jgi:branched-chain amino acid transport system ATP-binding protein
MTADLTLRGLSGGYGRLTIFRDLSLDVKAGDTVGILGPNGAGKTTLLKTIAGLLPCKGGTISLGGAPVQDWAAYRRARVGLSLVPEGRQIIGELTIEENLELARSARGDKASVGDALREVYGLFPILREKRALPGGSLSGGQQQMLAIGRALVAAPKVLMLDEPTQGLAPVVVNEVLAALRSLASRFTVVVVEQNRAFLEGLSGRLLRMESGRLTPLDR